MVTIQTGVLRKVPLNSKIQQRIFEYEARTGKRFVKQDAAKQLGMLPQQFSSLVAGKVRTTTEKTFKLAQMLECSVDDLYDYVEEEQK